MKKLLIAFSAGAVLMGSAAAFAADKTATKSGPTVHQAKLTQKSGAKAATHSKAGHKKRHQERKHGLS